VAINAAPAPAPTNNPASPPPATPNGERFVFFVLLGEGPFRHVATILANAALGLHVPAGRRPEIPPRMCAEFVFELKVEVEDGGLTEKANCPLTFETVAFTG
jgi:hypothetical protein